MIQGTELQQLAHSEDLVRAICQYYDSKIEDYFFTIFLHHPIQSRNCFAFVLIEEKITWVSLA